MIAALATLAIAPATAAIAAPPSLAGGGGIDVSLARILSALLVCLMLAAVAVLLLKRGGGRLDITALRHMAGVPTDRRIAVLETRRISAHADACLLRCDGIDYLILSSATQQQVLRQTPAAVSTS